MNRFILAASMALLADGALAEKAARDNPLIDSPTWAELQSDVVEDGVTLLDGSQLLNVEAPYRAHDAATVPLVISQADADALPITSAVVVIDENPAPIAAEMTFGEAMMPLQFEMRVRVNQYSNIRVIADTEAGSFMTGRFVKASGGCSAPATITCGSTTWRGSGALRKTPTAG